LHPTYVNIVNFDCYDMIIGMPFMRKNRVLLAFQDNCVIINGTSIPAVKVEVKDGDPRLQCYWVIDKKKQE